MIDINSFPTIVIRHYYNYVLCTTTRMQWLIVCGVKFFAFLNIGVPFASLKLFKKNLFFKDLLVINKKKGRIKKIKDKWEHAKRNGEK